MGIKLQAGKVDRARAVRVGLPGLRCPNGRAGGDKGDPAQRRARQQPAEQAADQTSGELDLDPDVSVVRAHGPVHRCQEDLRECVYRARVLQRGQPGGPNQKGKALVRGAGHGAAEAAAGGVSGPGQAADRAPGPEAGQHPAAQRAGQGGRLRVLSDPGRIGDGDDHPRLAAAHGPRGAHGRGLLREGGRLEPGDDILRDAVREGSVPGDQHSGPGQGDPQRGPADVAGSEPRLRAGRVPAAGHAGGRPGAAGGLGGAVLLQLLEGAALAPRGPGVRGHSRGPGRTAHRAGLHVPRLRGRPRLQVSQQVPVQEHDPGSLLVRREHIE